MTKKSEPKFQKDQVVYWGNGQHGYYRVFEITPHANGFLYGLANISREMQGFLASFPYRGVSEEVLRPLTASERGPVRRTNDSV
jgi:hypothetical protein